MLKRIIAGALAALLTFGAGAATLTPLSLLSPVGSTSGQVITSTGPSSAPIWGTVTLTGLGGLSTAAAASTYLTQANAASTYLTQANAASTYATKAGTLAQFASTTSAQLATLLSDETGSGANVFATAPTLNQPNIVGVTTNSNAAAGSVGEYLSTSSNSTSLTSATTGNATSLALTAGDWDVSCVVTFVPAASTPPSILQAGINTVSATTPASNLGGYVQLASTFATGAAQVMITPTVRVSLASSGTAFCIAQSTFTVSTMTVNGFIRARRVR